MARFSERIGGGEGFRVSVVTRPESPFYHLEVRVRKGPGNWAVASRDSLGTTDLAAARVAAQGLLVEMARRDPAALTPATRGRPSDLVARPEEAATLTWGRLAELYMASAAFADVEEDTRAQYAQGFAILLDFRDPVTALTWREMPPELLDQEKVDAFARARQSGAYQHPRARKGKCGPSTVRNYFTGLKAAASWAYRTKDRSGRRLLREKVFDGIDLPVQKNPVQPVMEDAWFDAMFALAARWPHSRAGVRHFRLLLLLGDAFGNRVDALLHLRWQDVDWQAGTLRWDPAFDKMEQGRTSPVPEDVLAALQEVRDHPARPVTPWVFWSRQDAEVPVSYETALAWFNAAWKLAVGGPKPRGLGWHSQRRRWATTREKLGLKTVMEAGGWLSASSALRYIQPDAASIRAAVDHGRRGTLVPPDGTTSGRNMVTKVVTPYDKRREEMRQVPLRKRVTR